MAKFKFIRLKRLQQSKERRERGGRKERTAYICVKKQRCYSYSLEQAMTSHSLFTTWRSTGNRCRQGSHSYMSCLRVGLGVYTIYLYIYRYTYLYIFIYTIGSMWQACAHVTNTRISLWDADVQFRMWAAGESREFVFFFFLVLLHISSVQNCVWRDRNLANDIKHCGFSVTMS